MTTERQRLWNKQTASREKKRKELTCILPTDFQQSRVVDSIKTVSRLKGWSLRLRLAFHFGTVRRMNFNTALLSVAQLANNNKKLKKKRKKKKNKSRVEKSMNAVLQELLFFFSSGTDNNDLILILIYFSIMQS